VRVVVHASAPRNSIVISPRYQQGKRYCLQRRIHDHLRKEREKERERFQDDLLSSDQASIVRRLNGLDEYRWPRARSTPRMGEERNQMDSMLGLTFRAIDI
jgi:hypothetical protein